MRKNWLLSDQRTIGLVATSVIAIPIIMAAIFFVLEGKSLHDVDEILLVSALYGFAEGVLVGIGVSVSNLLIGLVKRPVRNYIPWIVHAFAGMVGGIATIGVSFLALPLAGADPAGWAYIFLPGVIVFPLIGWILGAIFG
jgi:hypothetical protein